MPRILTDEEINRSFRIHYTVSTLIIGAGAIAMGYGYANIPNRTPEQDDINYQCTTTLEQQATDLRNYQVASMPFKIGMYGLAAFTVGFIIFIIYVRNNRILLDRAEIMRCHNRLPEHVPRQVSFREPIQIAPEPHEKQQQQQQPLQVQRLQQQQQVKPPYKPYHGHLPPEYRNYVQPEF